ncbi:unnamed protein product [Rhizophagus irregularis]|nr:unnamed protein product [Rhizophagus irregularis]
MKWGNGNWDNWEKTEPAEKCKKCNSNLKNFEVEICGAWAINYYTIRFKNEEILNLEELKEKELKFHEKLREEFGESILEEALEYRNTEYGGNECKNIPKEVEAIITKEVIEVIETKAKCQRHGEYDGEYCKECDNGELTQLKNGEEYQNYVENGFPEGATDMNTIGGFIYGNGKQREDIETKCICWRGHGYCKKHEHEIEIDRNSKRCISCEKGLSLQNQPNQRKEFDYSQWDQTNDIDQNINWGPSERSTWGDEVNDTYASKVRNRNNNRKRFPYNSKSNENLREIIIKNKTEEFYKDQHQWGIYDRDLKCLEDLVKNPRTWECIVEELNDMKNSARELGINLKGVTNYQK